jgi:hypothetical protein
MGWTWTEDMFEPVAKFKVGDIIIPFDGSWGVTFKDGKMRETYGTEIRTKKWKVLATDVNVPPVNFDGSIDYSAKWNGEPVRNDLILKSLTDDEVIFIHHDRCKLVPEPPKEVPFMEAITQWKPIKHGTWDEFVPINRALNIMSNKGDGTIHEMAKDKWYIKED